MPLFGRRKKLQTFTLDVHPVVGNIAPGESASASVAVSPSSKEVASVNLLAGSTPEGGGLPAGLNVSFNPPLGVPPFTSVMNISTSPEVASGAYPFLVVATGPGTKQMRTYTLIVRQKKPVAEKPTAEEPTIQPAQEQADEEPGKFFTSQSEPIV